MESVNAACINSFIILHNLQSHCSASFRFSSNYIKLFTERNRSSVFRLLCFLCFLRQALVDVGDKDVKFTGSKQWIGSTEVSYVLDHLIGVSKLFIFSYLRRTFVERGSSVVECYTRNRECGFKSLFAAVSKVGHFRSLHDTPVHMYV